MTVIYGVCGYLVLELYCHRVFQKYINLKRGDETAGNRRAKPTGASGCLVCGWEVNRISNSLLLHFCGLLLLVQRTIDVTRIKDGFGDLVVSILATGTRVRGFKPGQNRWIFRASGKSSVCLPSEGK